ncbi:hypothetical protein FLJC2902T_31810 [Flavobacterium limnosediminis JC2902]|uniref:Uncharacterized protein n=1 Tax=Flavobacterium limnosediminis JC2902 TaxID=1341181 RepID=V6SKR5_9FLAO|nr:hypothetical protein FLJC2902T_31810 [Flavobacterium limnosediminis JC2902]
MVNNTPSSKLGLTVLIKQLTLVPLAGATGVLTQTLNCTLVLVVTILIDALIK